MARSLPRSPPLERRLSQALIMGRHDTEAYEGGRTRLTSFPIFPTRRTNGKAAHLPRLVRKAAEAAAGANAWSGRRRARRTLDDFLQSWDHHIGAPLRAYS